MIGKLKLTGRAVPLLSTTTVWALPPSPFSRKCSGCCVTAVRDMGLSVLLSKIRQFPDIHESSPSSEAGSEVTPPSTAVLAGYNILLTVIGPGMSTGLLEGPSKL